MKKHILIIFLLLFLCSQFLFAQWISFDKSMKESKPSVKVLSSDNSGALIEISLSGMELKEKKMADKTFHSLSIPDYYTTLEVGKPQLPAIRKLLGVPDFKTYKVSIVDSSIITLTDYNVNPFQKPVREGEVEEFTIDESFYQKDCFFPENIVELDEPNIWRDIRVAKLSIYPIRYNPTTKVLKVLQKLVLRIDFEDAMGNAVIKHKPVSKEWKKIYKNSIINFDYLPIDLQNLNKSNSINSTGDYDYLIITAANYFDAIQPLAQWKTRQGLLSKVVSLNDIGNNETSIKNYITSEYNNHNIRYVLLVGDISQLCWSSTGPGDYWYSNLAGDIKPEIAIGRISVVSTTEVTHLVNKGIKYETIPPIDSWVRNTLLVAHKEGAPGKYQGCSEEIRTYDYVDDPVFTKAYGASTSVGGNEATNAQVTSYINSGMGVVNYRGHGSEYEWWNWNINNESYTTSNATALNNGNKMPIVFSIACDNASLDYSSACLAEAFTKANYGATAFLGATRASYTSANHAYDKKLFITAFNLDDMNIGYISNEAAVKIINEYGWTGEENAKMYLWLGDPSIELWTNTLQQYSSVQITDNGSSIIVNAGVAGSTICVSSGNNGSSYWNRVDNVSSYSFNTSVRPLYITVTKHNYIPYIAVTGGTFTSNEHWFGNIEILGNITLATGCSLTMNGNLTIPMGKVLTVQPGVNLKFCNNSMLTINGSLYVGDDITPTFVTFDFVSPNSTTQNGIKFNSGSSGFLFYSRIKNAYTGVYCNGYLPTIQNCIITNNRTGIYLYNVGTTSNAIMFNTIQSNTYEGIYMYNSSPRNITYNTISGNGQSGIYCSYSTPYIRLNTITNNGASGVCCVLYSPALFSNYWRDPGNNKITQNYWGVSCGLESHVRIGSDSYGGYNSIYSNTSHEVRADYDSHVMAEYNWWNVTTPPYYNPSDFSTSFGGTIDYDPALSSNPLGKVASPGGGEAITKNTPFFDFELKEALDKMLSGKYEDAISIYTKRLKKEKDISMKKYILTCIAECFIESGKEGFSQYLDDNARNNIQKSEELYAITLELDNLLYIKTGKYNKAIENLNTLKSGITDNGEIYKRTLYGLTHLAHSYSKDNALAKSYLNELKEKYPNDLLTRDAMFLLGDIDSLITIPFKDEDITISEASIINKGVFECYPNPFNPSTIISYMIPTPSNVTLKVYDILGREVAVLVNSIKDVGYYNTTFAASKMSSGIYFARLTMTPLDGTKAINQAKKMLLTK